MSKYLLTCGCGADVPVEVGQAGGKAVCPACGAALDVPTLRKLRHLPPAPAEAKPVSAAWSARKGVATAFLLLAAVLAAVALGSRFFEPSVPQFEPDAYIQSVDKGLEAMPPAVGFQLWVERYRPLAERGFATLEDPHKPAIEQYIAGRRFFQKVLLIAAAVCAAVAIAAALWPRSAPRRLAATR